VIGPHGEPLPLGKAGDLPYSKGLMTRALVAAGVAVEPAYLLATRVEIDLAQRSAVAVELDRLEELAVEELGPEEGPRIVARLRRYTALQGLDLPILLFVGGATGTGKSAVATEAAHRLGITRLTSTDFIRQTMRSFFSPEQMPSIHYSSFEAAAAVPGREDDDPAIRGFLEQTRNVLVGVEGAIERALTEGWSMTIEGVHLVPGLVPAAIEGALVVHAVLAIDAEDVHRMHFHVRDRATGGTRAMERYLEQLDQIRRLQAYIVGRAETAGVPVIEASNTERATAALLDLVLGCADRLATVA
jgi:2-phosphoglycerate kinase